MDTSQPSAAPLMQLATGFWASKALAAAIELDLFTQVPAAGLTLEEACQLLDLQPRPAQMLLSACASLGLLQKKGDHYANSALSQEYLVRGQPCYFGGVIRMLDKRLYVPWGRLVEALRTNRAQTWGDEKGLFEAIAKDPAEQRVFTDAMHSWSVQSGKALARAFEFNEYHRLLDVGGGSGAYCIEAARMYPQLQAAVYDIAPALAVAAAKIGEAGFASRVALVEGNFFTDPLPAGYDVMLLSMILHDWTPQKNRQIIARCWDALPPRGAIIVSELMMEDDRSGPPPAALMSLNMLIETEGQNYTWDEYAGWLEEAGFVGLRRVRIDSPGANGLLIGYKP